MRILRYHLVLSLLMLLLFPTLLPAQEGLLQEEKDFAFATQLADKELYDLAAQQFVKFADAWPTSPRAPEALFNAAENYEAIASFQRAADTYLRLVMSYPEAANADKAFFNRGKLLAVLGDPLNAALTLERIRIFTPNSELIPLAMVSAAEQFRSAGEAQKAYSAAAATIAQYSDSPVRPRAFFLLARLQHDAGKPALALTELNRIGAARVENTLATQIALLRARVLSELGRYSKSDSVLEVLVNSDTANDSIGAAACLLAQSLYSRGLYSKVIQTTERSLQRRIRPHERHQLQLYQGDSWASLGDPARALSSLSRIPHDSLKAQEAAKLAFRRGMLQKRLGEPALALPWFSQILAHADSLKDITALQRLALQEQTALLLELNNPGEALRSLRLLFEELPPLRDSILMQRASIVRTVLKNPVSARQDYALLSTFYPASPLADDAALGLARCHDEAGDRNVAIMAYQEFLALYPASEEGSEVEKRLTWLRLYQPAGSPERDLWISRALLAGGDSGSALAWAARRIEEDHDYQSGLTILRHILASRREGEVDESGLFYLAGLAHARLAEKYALEGDLTSAGLHADSLQEVNRFLTSRGAADPGSRTINGLAQLASWKRIGRPLIRAGMVDTLLARIQPSDSLAATLKLEQARIWYRFAADSSAHWYSRAAAACTAIAAAYPQPRIRLENALLHSRILSAIQLPDSAIQTLRSALAGGTISAQAAEASLELAGLLEKSNRAGEAAALYEDWLQTYGYAGRADSIRSRLCQIYFRQRQFERARQCMSRFDDGSALQELSPYLDRKRNETLLWLSAQAWLLQHDLPAAIQAFKEYIRINPEGAHRSEALLELANLYTLSGNFQAAAGHLEELIAASPQDSLALVALMRTADLLYDQHEFREAALRYARIKNAAGGAVQRQAAMNEVLCEYKQQNLARARQLADAFKKSFKERKAEALFLYEDGMISLANRDFVAAENQLKELTSKYRDLPEAADGEMGLARLYTALNKTDEALKILTNIPNRYTEPRIVALSYINLGEFYYENRQLENCMAAGRKALEFAPKGAEQQRAIALLITVFDDLRLWDNAVVLLRQYIQDYPEAEDLFNRKMQLGVFLINLKEYERGVDQLKSLLPQADAENEAEIQYWIARAYHERGDMNQAIIEYLKVKYVCRPSKLPWGTTALYEAGQTYAKLGNLVSARSLFEQIVREMGVGDQFGRVANERIREIDAALARQKG
ncbi:MAG TPA: tetratricopeptide repeat protein [bacterium]|nr:tetratricopeptide repeat protein [bacterium]